MIGTRGKDGLNQVQPFLKWAGGKRWFAEKYLDLMPDSFERFVEPFLGSGAVFFALRPRRALLSDLNDDLIGCYRSIRDEPDKIRDGLAYHQTVHSKEHYYRVRSAKPDDPTKLAVWFLYLNRTCWNGLYRVNKRNEFNVPKGTKTTVVLKTDDFPATARVLRDAEIRQCDFEETIDRVGAGDFVFVDPPYTVKHNLNGFVKYNDKIFSWNDQVRLRDAVVRARNRGAMIMVTNANHASISELYAGFGQHTVVDRASVLAGNAKFRSPTEELVIRSWL
ncbi:DNA adenine methylase [Maritimibacter dapengensis]|nr:Dam family site-specific DNA-(adenine-N6)-methyltransferase [Maritimibacter dapengensis]